VNILLRPHPTDEDAAMLSATSHIRVQVEEARADLIRYIRKRWMATRQQGGFDGLEGWAIKEISQGMLSVPALFYHLMLELVCVFIRIGSPSR